MDAESEQFLQALQTEATAFTQAVTTENGDWIIKGFIDVYRHVYTISVDTKLVSKVLELLLIPKLAEFGARNGYQMVLAPEQNFYPDISFVTPHTGRKFAVDIKSTYRSDAQNVNGMTLGAFTGYFRNRTSGKNITFPYAGYAAHIVLGAIYSKATDAIDEKQVHELDELATISSVVRDFVFFAQPKYRIASSRPGSGNTKNIGSVTRISQLLEGTGPMILPKNWTAPYVKRSKGPRAKRKDDVWAQHERGASTQQDARDGGIAASSRRASPWRRSKGRRR